MSRSPKTVALAAPLFLVVVLAAVGSPAVAESVVLVGATVHTAPGQVIEDATVVIGDDGTIAAVGASVQVPAGARTVDVSGKVVTVGFLDSSTRLGLVEVGAVGETRDFATDDDHITAAFDVVDGINPLSSLIPVTRQGGITRAVVAPTGGPELISGRGALVDLGAAAVGTPGASADVEEMLHRRSVAMFASLGATGARRAGGARGAAMTRLREVLADARDYARHREAFERGEVRDYSLSRLDLEALGPVVAGELPLVVEVNRASDILAVLRLGREEGLDLVLSGVVDGWMVADRIAEAGVPVLMDPMVNLPDFDGLAATLENAARLHEAGVRLAFATFDAHNSRLLRQAAGNAVAYGLPWDAALAAVTTVPAEIWGIGDGYGSIEAGKAADLVVWSGDPFELLSSVERVFVDGREVGLDSRQRRLFERYKDLDGPRAPAYDPGSVTRTGAPGRRAGGRGSAGLHPVEAPLEDRHRRVHLVAGLAEGDALGSVEDLVGDVLAAHRRQVVQEDGGAVVLRRARHEVGGHRVGGEGLLPTVAVLAGAHGHPAGGVDGVDPGQVVGAQAVLDDAAMLGR